MVGSLGPEGKVWELSCYCLIFAIGLVGNLTVCLVVLKSGPRSHPYRRMPFNIYLMSLAIVDLLLAVVCLPVYVMSTQWFPHPTGTKGTILCKTITGYLLPFWFAGVSIYMLVIISFERYAAISRPFLNLAHRETAKINIYVACAWCIGFVIQIPTIIGVEVATNGTYCCYSWENKTTITSIYVCTFTLQYAVPAVIFIVNFYRIQKCLKRLDENLKQGLVNGGQLVILMKKRKKTIQVVFLLSAAFFVCWTPNNVMYFLFQYGQGLQVSWTSNIYQVGIILGFFNSCMNPFLYAFQSREFRNNCKQVLRKTFRNISMSHATQYAVL